jgi:hypothetical protein
LYEYASVPELRHRAVQLAWVFGAMKLKALSR